MAESQGCERTVKCQSDPFVVSTLRDYSDVMVQMQQLFHISLIPSQVGLC